jgi:hypothetical protein
MCMASKGKLLTRMWILKGDFASKWVLRGKCS